MAPEIVKKDYYQGEEVDIWALGVVLYKMLTGAYPFGSEEEDDLKANILRGKIQFPFYITPRCKELLKRMMCLDTSHRFNISEVRLASASFYWNF